MTEYQYTFSKGAITYTLTVQVTGGTTTQDLVVTDTLGAGLDFGNVTALGPFAADTGSAPELSFNHAAQKVVSRPPEKARTMVLMFAPYSPRRPRATCICA